jgi:hypothetical protein
MKQVKVAGLASLGTQADHAEEAHGRNQNGAITTVLQLKLFRIFCKERVIHGRMGVADLTRFASECQLIDHDFKVQSRRLSPILLA